MFDFFLVNLADGFSIIWYILREGWWIIFPPLILYVAAENYKYYVQTRELKNTVWSLLEITIPREILKSPEAMERVFAGLHGPYDPPTAFRDYYLYPKIRLYYSFEIAGTAGDMHFYIRIPKSWRNMVEAQLYAQYPDVTITEAKDHTSDLPQIVPDDEYDLWGMEVQFEKEDSYPVLTYKDFTTLTEAKLEEVKVDPLSAFSESFSKLRPGEYIWYQIIARPCGPPGQGAKDDWQKDGQAVVDKLAGRDKPKKKPWWAGISEVLGAFFEEGGEMISEALKPGSSSGEKGLGRFAAPPAKKEESKKDPSKLLHITPGEKDVIAAIEHKIGKMGYECVVRIMYLARRDVMDMATIGSLFGMIKQFNTQNANAFRPVGDTLTRKKYYLWGFIVSKTYNTKKKIG